MLELDILEEFFQLSSLGMEVRKHVSLMSSQSC